MAGMLHPHITCERCYICTFLGSKAIYASCMQAVCLLRQYAQSRTDASWVNIGFALACVSGSAEAVGLYDTV